MPRQVRRSSAHRADSSAAAGPAPRLHPEVEAPRTDDLLEEIDAVLDSVGPEATGRRSRQEPDDHHDVDLNDLPDYATLHRWLGYLCVTLFVWILLVSALGGPVLWIRYGMH